MTSFPILSVNQLPMAVINNEHQIPIDLSAMEIKTEELIEGTFAFILGHVFKDNERDYMKAEVVEVLPLNQIESTLDFSQAETINIIIDDQNDKILLGFDRSFNLPNSVSRIKNTPHIAPIDINLLSLDVQGHYYIQTKKHNNIHLQKYATMDLMNELQRYLANGKLLKRFSLEGYFEEESFSLHVNKLFISISSNNDTDAQHSLSYGIIETSSWINEPWDIISGSPPLSPMSSISDWYFDTVFHAMLSHKHTQALKHSTQETQQAVHYFISSDDNKILLAGPSKRGKRNRNRKALDLNISYVNKNAIEEGYWVKTKHLFNKGRDLWFYVSTAKIPIDMQGAIFPEYFFKSLQLIDNLRKMVVKNPVAYELVEKSVLASALAYTLTNTVLIKNTYGDFNTLLDYENASNFLIAKAAIQLATKIPGWKNMVEPAIRKFMSDDTSKNRTISTQQAAIDSTQAKSQQLIINKMKKQKKQYNSRNYRKKASKSWR